MRKYPTNAGIDVAGTVESSADPRFKPGDKVIVTGYDLGVAHDGGYAEYVRVPADWVVRRPESMTAFDAMTLGTAGFTAALGRAADGAQRPDASARPGRASRARREVSAPSRSRYWRSCGYHVVAITGKPEEADYLKDDRRVRKFFCGNRSMSRTSGRSRRRRGPASVRQPWRRSCLASLLAMMKIGGTVAAVGSRGGHTSSTRR